MAVNLIPVGGSKPAAACLAYAWSNWPSWQWPGSAGQLVDLGSCDSFARRQLHNGASAQANNTRRRPGLQQLQQLDEFLAGIQQRAFRMAMASLAHREDALDAVQDAMCKLVEKYRDKPAPEWAPLFYRILYSRITDIQRRRSSRGKVFGAFFFSPDRDTDIRFDPIAEAGDASNPDPARYGVDSEFGDALQRALLMMPQRQRQAFMLRAWEGLNVKQTALAMSCGEGSVKTHYSRARHFLQQQLKGFADTNI